MFSLAHSSDNLAMYVAASRAKKKERFNVHKTGNFVHPILKEYIKVIVYSTKGMKVFMPTIRRSIRKFALSIINKVTYIWCI